MITWFLCLTVAADEMDWDKVSRAWVAELGWEWVSES